MIINQTCRSPCWINTLPAIFPSRFAVFLLLKFLLLLPTIQILANPIFKYYRRPWFTSSHPNHSAAPRLCFIQRVATITEEVKTVKQKQLLLKLGKDRNSDNRNIHLLFFVYINVTKHCHNAVKCTLPYYMET